MKASMWSIAAGCISMKKGEHRRQHEPFLYHVSAQRDRPDNSMQFLSASLM